MTSSSNTDITEKEVDDAQAEWCTRLIEISREYRENGDDGEYRALAQRFIDDLYDFKNGKVFFRPTLASPPQNFRTTAEGALSYFIGENPNFPNDKGFAKSPWVAARHDNAIEGSNAIQTHGNIGMAMGNVYLKEEASIGNREVVVDKVFAYRKDPADGKLRLIVHKSALTNELASEPEG